LTSLRTSSLSRRSFSIRTELSRISLPRHAAWRKRASTYSWFMATRPSADEPPMGKKWIPSWCMPTCMPCSTPVFAPSRKAGIEPEIGVPQGARTWTL